MKNRITLAVFFLSLAASAQVLIPTNRLPPLGYWKAGIIGGIPTNYSLYCNVRTSIPGTNIVAVGNGIADDTVALQTAINGATNCSYVYIPAGTYKITSALVRNGEYNLDSVHHPFSIVIRGDGPTQTKIVNYAATGNILSFGAGSGENGWQGITDGATLGSTQVLISSTANIPTNFWVIIQTDNTSSGYTNVANYMLKVAATWAKVVAKSATQLTLDRPLYFTLPGMQVAYEWSVPYRCGIEDLSVTWSDNQGGSSIVYNNAQECWIKNVESDKCKSWHIDINESAGCEVRQCYVHDTWYDGYNGGGNSDYGICLFQKTGETLVEDCIGYHCRHSFITEYAGYGNVFAYNYSKDPINEGNLSTDYLMGDCIHHGGDPRYTLWEGNISGTIKFDRVLGSSAYNTSFRHYMTRSGLASTYVACFAADIQQWNYWTSLIGCVFGIPPAESSSDTFRFGTNQDGPLDDTNSQWTCWVHGCYNMTNSATTWDGTSTNRIIPVSLLYTNKPSWWTAGLAWPSVGPDCTPVNGKNPAQLRYEAGINSLSITPVSLDFGSILVNATSNLSFLVQNVGTNVLAGTASATAVPFSVSGTNYSLVVSQVSTVTVTYAPISAGTNTSSIIFTGGSGSTNVVTGIATNSNTSPISMHFLWIKRP
jgi:hypothetical protein